MALPAEAAASSPPAEPSDQSIAVRLERVEKRYGDVIAVDGIDLDVRDGEFFSMLGPSGSGKTTTLRMIAGFEQPTSGRVVLHGRDVTGVPPFERDVNTVFQDYALFPHMTVGDNVGYGLMVRKVDKTTRRERVAEALRMVRLPGYEQRKPNELSGGQRQRIALARALVNRPRVLLLDEPLGALDLKLRVDMQRELKRIQREVGITFVYVTHDQDEALSMSDRLAVFNEGRLEQVGTPAEVYERPANVFVAGFVGVSNVLEREGGKIVEGDGWTIRSALESIGAVDGRAALAAVRPEAIMVSDEQPAAGQNAISGELASISHLGDVIQFVVRTPGRKEIIARLPRPRAPRLDVGGPVHCSWGADHTHVFGAEQAKIVLADPTSDQPVSIAG